VCVCVCEGETRAVCVRSRAHLCGRECAGEKLRERERECACVRV